MADINVERKGPSVWPWVIGLLVLALLIWALVEMFGGNEDAVMPDTVEDTFEVESEVLPPPDVVPDTGPGLGGVTPGAPTPGSMAPDTAAADTGAGATPPAPPTSPADTA